MKQTTGVNSVSNFEAWYEGEFDSLFTFVMFKTNNIEDAEDICAIVCEKALRNHHQFDSNKGSFSNWIYTIARNCIKNYYREQNRENSKTTPLDFAEELGLVVSSINPEISLVEKEQFVRVVEALKLLSVQEQDIIALRYGADFSYIEIAKHLEISVPMVGVSLYRSRKKLRQIIELEEAKHGS